MSEVPIIPDLPKEYHGRVIKSFGKRFIVSTRHGTFDCELRGRLRLTSRKVQAPVVVGDIVDILVDAPPYGVIESVHPRRNKFSRPDVLQRPGYEQVFLSNCEQLVVVASIAQPRLKLGMIDRFLIAAECNNMDGVLVINKADLADAETIERPRRIYTMAGYPVIVTSAATGQGMEELRNIARYKTSMFCGHSGVGKSSILNTLEPGLTLATKEISESTGKGVHTTTAVELHPLSFGGYIADTPGIKVIGLWNLTAEDLQECYPEFRKVSGQCKFRNCMHIGEPDCAITRGVEDGTIARERLDAYRRIRDTL